MKVDKYSHAVLAVLSYSFYIFQALAFGLAVATLVKTISSLKSNKVFQNYLALIISVIVGGVFCYEAYWFLEHL